MRKRKFAEGGDVDPLEEANKAGGEDVSVSSNPDGSSAASNDAMDSDKPSAPQTFKQAFAAARKEGGKTFMWNGKKYTTDLAPTKKTLPTVTVKGDSATTTARKSGADYSALDKVVRDAPAGTSKAAMDAAKRNRDDAMMKYNRDSKIAADPTKSVVRMKSGGMVRGCGIAQRGLTKARSK